MGGSSSGSSSSAYIAPNTGSSAQTLRLVHAICEGEIYGFANGNDYPLKSVYFDNTPVQNGGTAKGVFQPYKVVSVMSTVKIDSSGAHLFPTNIVNGAVALSKNPRVTVSQAAIAATITVKCAAKNATPVTIKVSITSPSGVVEKLYSITPQVVGSYYGSADGSTGWSTANNFSATETFVLDDLGESSSDYSIQVTGVSVPPSVTSLTLTQAGARLPIGGDGTFNFYGVSGSFTKGNESQSYLPGFDKVEISKSVGAEVKATTPITRTVSNSEVNAVTVTVGVNRNSNTNTKTGDVYPMTTQLVVEIVKTSTVASQVVTFTEKSSGVFYTDVTFDNLPEAPFNVRVSRLSEDSTTDDRSNATYFASYLEIVNVKQSHPNTALAAWTIDSDQFGGSIPNITYHLLCKLIQVPSNYDPFTGAYDAGIWDGSFKTAWSNNPAWILYDVLTNSRYSSIASRLDATDIDKWTLYSIGKWCDEQVDDGFGSTERRAVCNCYITDEQSAYDLIADLCSIFTGYQIWNGSQFSVVVDKDEEPTAIYTNSNVVDGTFTYAGVGAKSVHTAVYVTYADINNNFESTTEFVQDDAAVQKYGFNAKDVTAFGCDSQGQAVRFAKWILETELRQQRTLTFSIGREGLKHLPHDIIRVADNDYAGIPLGGRLLAVSGSTITVDQIAENVVGGTLFVVNKEGQQEATITAQAGNVLTLDKVLSVSVADSWVIHKAVASKLYRCISITENTDDGTYTISALQHDPEKYGVVDSWASFPVTVNTADSVDIDNIDVKQEDGDIVVSWDGSITGSYESYDIKLFRNGALYRHIPDATSASTSFSGLPSGTYRLEIRGRTSKGYLSEAYTKVFTIDYDISGFRTTAGLFSIKLDWETPQTVVNQAATEIYYGTTTSFDDASLLISVTYPTTTYTMPNVKLSDVFYFWARFKDESGYSGEFVGPIQGLASADPAAILEQLNNSLNMDQFAPGVADDLMKEVANYAGDDNKLAGNDGTKVGKWDIYSQIMEGDRALGKQVKAIKAEMDNGVVKNLAAVAEQIEVVATEQSAQATKIETVQASVDGVQADVAETKLSYADLSGKLSATWQMRVSVDTPSGTPIVGGIALSADTESGASELVIQADKFAVWTNKKKPLFIVKDGIFGINGDLVVSDSISGKTLIGNTLRGGSISIGDGKFAVSSAGTVSIRSDASKNVGLQITNEAISVYDESGTLRVKLGKL